MPMNVLTYLERFSERTLGIVGVIVTVVGTLFVAAISFVPFGQQEYTAILEHTAGIRVGEEVQVAGVGSGEVRGIELDGHQVRLSFTLDKDIRLGRSTTASVKVATLLGSHFLEVKPAGQGSLPDDTIPLSRTSVPFNLQDVIEGANGELDDLDTKTVSESLQVVADTLRDTPKETRAAIDGVARLSEVAARRSNQMSALLGSADQVTGQLARNSAEIIDLLKQSSLVLEELTKRRDVIHAMLIDARRLATEVQGVLADNEKELDPLMKDFSAALANLRKQEKNINASISGLATMAHYFANAAGNGPWIDLHVPVGLPDNLTCGTGCG
jgi:phospholipid/cholesterol/gamma-HCH transport system substrate-binding protein